MVRFIRELLCATHNLDQVSVYMTQQDQKNSASPSNDESPVRVTFVIEWANTTYNGIPRFWGMLDILINQLQEVSDGKYPENLPERARYYLDNLERRPELLIVSGEQIDPDLQQRMQDKVNGAARLGIHVKEGLEYYALKNFGGELAAGDIICFIDSDVYPNEGWMAHLLGSFSMPEVVAVAGQPYIAPVDLFSRAFALGWTYELADTTGKMFPAEKYYTNNFLLRKEIFRRFNFPQLKRRTRGAASLYRIELKRHGYEVWENRKALVDHPAPSSMRHMVIRAIAHGRDYYMKESEERNFAGLVISQKTAAQRLVRGIYRTFRDWRKVELSFLGIPFVVGIISSYYVFFSLGGLLTHISPAAMGRRYRL